MDISDWRKKIDEVDTAVLKLLNLRAEMALEIGKLKSQEGIGLRTPTREREIVERMQSANPGPLDSEAIERIYETIVNQCIRAQERSRSGSLRRSRRAMERAKRLRRPKRGQQETEAAQRSQASARK